MTLEVFYDLETCGDFREMDGLALETALLPGDPSVLVECGLVCGCNVRKLVFEFQTDEEYESAKARLKENGFRFFP